MSAATLAFRRSTMTKVRSVCRTRNSPVSEFSHIAKDTSSQFGTCRPTKLDKIKNFYNYFHSGTVIGFQPGPAVKPVRRRAADQYSSVSSTAEALANLARASGFCRVPADLGTNETVFSTMFEIVVAL